MVVTDIVVWLAGLLCGLMLAWLARVIYLLGRGIALRHEEDEYNKYLQEQMHRIEQARAEAYKQANITITRYGKHD